MIMHGRRNYIFLALSTMHVFTAFSKFQQTDVSELYGLSPEHTCRFRHKKLHTAETLSPLLQDRLYADSQNQRSYILGTSLSIHLVPLSTWQVLSRK
mmetsp:Transcript_18856/g.46262  ORF Transcript_18856/g.46262 Transcript_18856/m.46262 type:complete len:97 (+) Transcript_18856:66-356(+)